MIDAVDVKTAFKEYEIFFADSFSGLSDILVSKGLSGRKTLIVSDSNVYELYLDEVRKIFESVCPFTRCFVFDAGEESKNLDTVKASYKFLADNLYDRKTLVVALGGGVTGDMAGFVAATFNRGVSYIQIPTTLLSQVDSSVGGKVGVDFSGGKNIIGAFYQPEFVFENISALKTLPKEQFASGMGEVIKHGLIKDRNYFELIFENRERIKNLDLEIVQGIIKRSCEIKAEVVSQDEKELGIREILNFGHTAGHAIESLSEFSLPHGACVSIGSVCSLLYSLEKNFISESEFYKILDLYKYFSLLSAIDSYDTDEIIKKMYSDKKTKDNVITFVVLTSIGKAESVKIPDDEIIRNLLDKSKKIINEVIK